MAAPIALVDCNNFYASCERVFQPALRGQRVVVRIPTQSGQAFRFESGPRSDLKAATIPI